MKLAGGVATLYRVFDFSEKSSLYEPLKAEKWGFFGNINQVLELKGVRIGSIQNLRAYRSGFTAQGKGKIKRPTPQASQPHPRTNLGSSILAVKGSAKGV